MLSRTVFFVLSLALVNGEKFLGTQRNQCLSTDIKPYIFHGSKTQYSAARGNADSSTECKPIQFWSLNRHGTRYAKEGDLQDMKLAEKIRRKIFDHIDEGRTVSLCKGDLDLLDKWEWNNTIDDKGNYLTEQGVKESAELAQRYKLRYPELLGGEYSNQDFYFRHTTEQRTEATCKAYVEGLFGDDASKVEIDEPRENDTEIRAYSACPAWHEAVEANEDFKKEQKRIFRKQEDYLQLLSDVSKRLGYVKILDKDDIDIMFDNCRYERAWYPYETSPWCSVFTKEELVLLEYHDDLGAFYKNGYGHPYHPKLGCMPLTNMINHFNKTMATKVAKPKAVNLFTHDTMLSMTYTALSFANDHVMLLGTNYDDLLYERKFRSSLNVPFGANLAAVLHQCADEEYKVQFFVNERPMELDGCKNGFCSWKDLMNLLPNIYECNLDFCYQ